MHKTINSTCLRRGRSLAQSHNEGKGEQTKKHIWVTEPLLLSSVHRRLPWAICCVFLGPPCEHRSICDATKKLLGCIIVWQKPLFSVSNQILYKGCARVNLQSRLEFCNFSSSLYFLFSVMRGRESPKPPHINFPVSKVHHVGSTHTSILAALGLPLQNCE